MAAVEFERVHEGEAMAAPGPSAPGTATARFSAATGPGATDMSRSYSRRIRSQPVAPALGA
ncbi:hypothetical protein [Streptomyces djakartensis]|uniref:hypothetical protein n=1 Tax=Streptomyces djakartensis TaxID=68193 RepID=UPI0034DDF8DD